MIIRLAYIQSRNKNITKLKNNSGTRKKKGHHITAVTRNGEKGAKFTFIFRKKFYLGGKYIVPKFATSCSRETLAVILPNVDEFNNLMQQMINFIFVELWKNYVDD